MDKILYISNVEVPYRVEFFNQLAEKTDLTVLYERLKSSNRNFKWSKSIKSKFKIIYLKGIEFNKEYSFDFRILKYVFDKKYKKVIIGCYNSPSQILSIIAMRLLRRKYILNLDGEYFLDGNSLKSKLKRFLIKGAYKYIVAGTEAANNLSNYVPKDKIFSYNFSSLTKKEILENCKHINNNNNNKILVVGQYYPYKGLDIALDVAKKNKLIEYIFIGSNNRSELLKEKIKRECIDNVEVIPFLKKEDLYKEYQNCKCLFMPSIKECWGLVINEAASFGCPIISSDGAGAAKELLNNRFGKYLYKSGNSDEAYEKINNLFKDNITKYRKELIEINKEYNIERSVEQILEALGDD